MTGLDEHSAANTWEIRVRRLLRENQGPWPSLEQVAMRLCTSARSLRRNLARQGCSYQQLLNQERYQRAMVLLSETTLPICEIAFQLVFSDQSNFRRAFRQWSGKIPGSLRE
ncbi:AraC family transcriptional regulator [Ectopseudomonas mendocina]|uniref:AraC family transcriptional regulator n=1 Tax=Ectopseudomonas mendocina TaxID=300 RepID=A0ABZ2RFZ8_ECTME